MRKVNVLAAVALLAGLLWALPALSQEDMKTVPNEVFGTPQKSAAVFAHDMHNEKAKLEDCGACHHGDAAGKADPASPTPGQPCAECHPVQEVKGKTPLMRAFHRQCVGCHHDSGKGPLTCGECHG